MLIHTKIQRIKGHKDLRTQLKFRKLKIVQKVVHDEHQEPSPEIHEPNEEHARFM